MDYEGTRFDGGEVRLDGNQFDRCIFTDCALLYDGGPVHLVGCEFSGTITWQFGGALATGLSVIGTLYRQNHEQALVIVSQAMFPHAAVRSDDQMTRAAPAHASGPT